MLSKNNYWRFAVSVLVLLGCLGFETATAHTPRRIKNQQQSSQKQSDSDVVHLFSPEAKQYLSTQDNSETEGQLIQTKQYHCHKARHRKARHHQIRRHQVRRHRVDRCPCPVYHPRRVYHPQRVYYHQTVHHHYYGAHPRKNYRHGIPQHENIYRGHPRYYR